MTTMTIELDDETLDRIKQLAAFRKLSVPDMVRRLLDVRLAPPPQDLGPHTLAATGVAPPMTDEEVERVLDERRMRKYGGQ